MTRPVTFLKLLRHGHLRVATAAVTTFGLALAVIAHVLLSGVQERHLELVARTLSYSVEAAITFRDEQTAGELLRDIAGREGLIEARVLLPSGEVLASHTTPDQGTIDRLMREVGALLMHSEARSPVLLDGRTIGQVRLRGDGTLYAWLLVYGAIGAVLCIGASLAAGTLMTRRMEHSILDPINQLAALTRSIRSERTYARRAPAARIAELQALSEDFNAMLDEVQLGQAELLARHRRLQSDNDVLAHKAWHDELTGLANRSQFERRLQEALNSTSARGGHLAVLFLDADGFKAVNDTAGHAAGDRLLAMMADRLRTAVRETDVVARLGGDEFAVLLHPLRSVDDARRVGQKIHSLMTQPFDLDEHGHFHCGLSAGMATYPLDGDTIPALLDTADRAMYRAKHAGKRARHKPLAGPGMPYPTLNDKIAQ
ncbi:diguanylate cyclase domain-containing protein [Sphaerotilus sp.]|uniref:diguanylate cyclase domain-containing protein n=1 Tax=Sphaerotilus sp. TaxID=2093942 RepID=UPI0025EC6957|nr:diguanylate cyclase [Sphaerotilus sp.]